MEPKSHITTDASSVIDILSTAFIDDPLMAWRSPDSSYPRFLFEAALPIYIKDNQSYLIDGKAAAVWTPPNSNTAFEPTLSLVLTVIRRYGFRCFYRAYKIMIKLRKHHPSYAHYYLLAIGTVAKARNQGCGSALIEEVLTKCDAENLPAYLENSNEENLQFYCDLGFEVIEKIQIAKGCPNVWAMLRPPSKKEK